MSKDKLADRFKSNEGEKDEFFLPSGDMWDRIEKSIDDKNESNRWFFRGMIALFLILIIGLVIVSRGDQNTADGIIEPNLSLKSFASDENSVKENLEIYSDNSYEKADSKIVERIEIATERLSSKSIVQKHQAFSIVNSATEQNNSTVQGSESLQNGIISESHDSKQLTNKPSSNALLADRSKKISLPLLDKLVLTGTVSDKSDHSLLKINLHDFNQKSPSSRRMTVAIGAYSSLTNYNVDNYSGYGNTSFNLSSDFSYGYILHLEKYISNRIYGSIGLGVDYSHFTADYDFHVEMNDDVQVSFRNNELTGNLTKPLPSLAGGLLGTFEVSAYQGNPNDVYQLSLGHNYTTVSVPATIGIDLKSSRKMKWRMAINAEWTQRLVTVDTDINTLFAHNTTEKIMLSGIKPLANEIQPFRIHNFNIGLTSDLVISITSRLSTVFQINYLTPVQNIYEDSNFSVRTESIRSGIRLRYEF